MFNKLISILLLVSVMSACSSDNTSVVLLPDGPSVDIITVSGGVHTLSGTYFSLCYPQNITGSRKDNLLVNHDTWTNTANVYTSADCGMVTPETPVVSTITATMVKGSTTAITGWVDGTAIAPNAEDGSGQLNDNEAVTEIEMTVSDVTGTQFSPAKAGDKFKIFYVADDTAADSTGFNTVLYRDDDADTNSDASTIAPFIK